MSNVEAAPAETECANVLTRAGSVQVIPPRDVPLGGPRAMTVRRTLPSRERSLIGAWCFLDHYGPDDVAATGGMHVPPHPHTGLQTISWLFSGHIEHRDSAGHRAVVSPGALYLMTAGRGINHSEYSTADTTVLHGAQLWVALPDAARHADPGLASHIPDPVEGDGVIVRVFLGSLAGSTSPVRTFTGLLGAELVLDAGATVHLDIERDWEHGVLVDHGALTVDQNPLERGELAYLAPGRATLTLTAGPTPVRLLLIGGAPLGESITMWWNFVGRSHDDVVAQRDRWQRQLGAEGDAAHSGGDEDEPYGPLVGAHPLPAPVLPNVRLRPRG